VTVVGGVDHRDGRPNSDVAWAPLGLIYHVARRFDAVNGGVDGVVTVLITDTCAAKLVT